MVSKSIYKNQIAFYFGTIGILLPQSLPFLSENICKKQSSFNFSTTPLPRKNFAISE